jgi:hypothetical protein
MLVFLIWGLYEVCHSDSLKSHDVLTKFRRDLSGNQKLLCEDTHTSHMGSKVN